MLALISSGLATAHVRLPLRFTTITSWLIVSMVCLIVMRCALAPAGEVLSFDSISSDSVGWTLVQYLKNSVSFEVAVCLGPLSLTATWRMPSRSARSRSNFLASMSRSLTRISARPFPRRWPVACFFRRQKQIPIEIFCDLAGLSSVFFRLWTWTYMSPFVVDVMGLTSANGVHPCLVFEYECLKWDCSSQCRQTACCFGGRLRTKLSDRE